MAIVIHQDEANTSKGYMITNAYCDAPLSDTTDDLWLFISYFNVNGDTTSLVAPAISGVTGDLISAASRVAWYRFDGGSSGSANFSFSTNPASFRAFFVRVSGIKSTTPYSAGYSATPTGTSHLINAGTTAPFPGAAFVAAIATTGYPNGISSFLVDFDSPDSIHDEGEDYSREGGIAGGGPTIIIMPLNVAVRYAENAGDTGSHTWSSVSTISLANVTSSIAGAWVSPLQAPSAPVVTAPITNGKFTIGSTQNITYISATDPNVDTADLIYKIYYSNNTGITYTLLTTTAMGVLSYAWDTTGLSPGTYKIKVVANNGTDDGEPGYSGNFQLFADVAPGAPTNLFPTGYISQAAIDFTWQGNYPDFDSQGAYELRYSSNPDMSSPTTTGKVSSTAELKAWSASSGILSSLGQKYWDVATYDLVGDVIGPFAQATPVNVAAAPATPTITSSSTISTATWAFTFTAIAHTRFKIRILIGGNPRLTATIQSSAFSFTPPFGFLDGETGDVYISVFDPLTGLESAEATQAFTVTYIGPAQPTLDVVPIDGAFQLAIDNPTPADVDHNRILRSLNGGDYELISPRLGPNGLYIDNHVANDLHSDYNKYSYKVRAYKITTLGITESDASDPAGVQIGGLYLHVVDKASTTSNAGLSVKLSIAGPIVKRFVKKQRSVAMKGRTQFITLAGQAKHTELVYQCIIPRGDTTTFPALLAVFEANAILSIRDSDHNAIFGRVLDIPRTADLAKSTFSLTCIETDFREVHSR
jgi:hypothetical protein